MEKSRSPLRSVILIAIAGLFIGLLTTRGVFDNVANFPLVFAAVGLVVGVLTAWQVRERPRQAALAIGLVALGAAACFAGWSVHRSAMADRVANRTATLKQRLVGSALPPLTELEPLNVDQASWNEAADLDSPATIVAFWARWCSPCWKEMPELEQLYREHASRGLSVVAVTRYDGTEPGKRSEQQRKALAFFEDRGLSYPGAITDENSVYESYEVRSLPTTLLLDREGRVVDVALSLEGSRRLMARALNLLDPDLG